MSGGNVMVTVKVKDAVKQYGDQTVLKNVEIHKNKESQITFKIF